MVNIILMSHFAGNQHLYTGLFSRIPFVRFVVISLNGPDVYSQVELINNQLAQSNLTKDDIDFIMLSSNYGIPANDDVNIPMFTYFLQNYKYAQLIALGNTTASLIKALELDERIYIMGTSVGDVDLELVSRIFSKDELKPRICSFKCLRILLQLADNAKKEGKRLDNINAVKQRLHQASEQGVKVAGLETPKPAEKRELVNALQLVQNDMKNMSLDPNDNAKVGNYKTEKEKKSP